MAQPITYRVIDSNKTFVMYSADIPNVGSQLDYEGMTYFVVSAPTLTAFVEHADQPQVLLHVESAILREERLMEALDHWFTHLSEADRHALLQLGDLDRLPDQFVTPALHHALGVNALPITPGMYDVPEPLRRYLERRRSRRLRVTYKLEDDDNVLWVDTNPPQTVVRGQQVENSGNGKQYEVTGVSWPGFDASGLGDNAIAWVIPAQGTREG